jgi:exonuclease SbcC
MLEFYILQSGDLAGLLASLSLHDINGSWKPLTERTLRDTQALIEATLRMDYETFVNASFFLQGKADQFTQQRSGDRKRILGSILGLEIWEQYRQRAAEMRRSVEDRVSALDARLDEINRELAEEAARKTRLKELEINLERFTQARLVQETNLERITQIAATLAEQRKLVETLRRQMEASQRQLNDLLSRAARRERERGQHAALLERAGEIEAAYEAWQQARRDLEQWNEVAARFQEQQQRRQPPLDEINAARARLMQEQQTLLAQKDAINTQLAKLPGLQAQIDAACQEQTTLEKKLTQRVELDDQLQAARQRQADAKAENPRLKAEMDELKARIDQLEEAEGADCPVCGQPLSPDERQSLIEELKTKGRQMGDRFRLNQALLKEFDQTVQLLEGQLRDLAPAEAGSRAVSQVLAQLEAQSTQIESQLSAWEQEGAPRLAEVTAQLAAESYAPQARQLLQAIDAELKTIGYDASAHDVARRAEQAGRLADEEQRALGMARATLASLEREIAELEGQIRSLQTETARQQTEHDQAAARLAAAEAEAPDINAARRDLFNLQEQEQHLRMELGAAQQLVLVLDEQKKRRKAFQSEREELARSITQFKQLERAFGKDGVPALLIEQALPQIEAKANAILERLSGGGMAVRFITQSAYKDRRRDDLKETLDIQISDGAGTRDYEMFSGGEAFRVNFAVRLALSEVLAQRAGARLQTLVIDEGFGSQDALGRQRLIEAINLVRQDFAKVLVITHIEELKDAFPHRIEVEKTARGSSLRVV